MTEEKKNLFPYFEKTYFLTLKIWKNLFPHFVKTYFPVSTSIQQMALHWSILNFLNFLRKHTLLIKHKHSLKFKPFSNIYIHNDNHIKCGTNLNEFFIHCTRSVHQFVLDLRTRCYYLDRERGMGKGLSLIDSPFFSTFKFIEFEAACPEK